MKRIIEFFKSQLFKSKIIFIGLPLALLSFEIYFGIIFGYLASRIFAGHKTGQRGMFKSISFNIGQYRLHLHHWLVGTGIFITGIWYHFLPFPQFSYGFLGGCIYHGIFSYSDWYRIFAKDTSNFFNKFHDSKNKKIS